MQYLRAIGRYVFTAVCFSWTGGKLVLDWLGRGLSAADAASSKGFTAKGIALVFQAPWWAPVLVWALAACFLAYVSRQDFRSAATTTNQVRSGSIPISAVIKSPIASTIIQSKQLLESAMVLDGYNGNPPNFRSNFGSNGREINFYIEVSFYAENLLGPSGWTQPRKFKVFSQQRYSKGEFVSFPLICHVNFETIMVWKLGRPDDEKDMINTQSFYRGRVTALDSDDNEQHVYFVLASHAGSMPTVLGQHMFEHMLTWEQNATA